MKKSLLKLLFQRGLAEKATTEEAWNFFYELEQEVQRSLIEAAITEAPVTPAPIEKHVAPDNAGGRALEFSLEIMTRCNQLGMPKLAADLASELKEGKKTEEQVRAAIFNAAVEKLETKEQASPNAPVVQGGITDQNKRREAFTHALILRSGISMPENTVAPGARELMRLSFENIARECLRHAGIDTSMMGKEAVLKRAMQTRAPFPGMDSGDFPYIMSASANLAMLMGFGQQPTTYQNWTKIVNISDFKVQERVRLSDMGLLEQITKQGELKRGKILGFTRETFINDSANALGDLFQAFGLTTARTINAFPYALLKANAVMGDGVRLFHADHGNIAAAGAAPGNDSFSAMTKAMRKQTGPKGMKLNIQPRYALVGPNNSDNLLVVLNSESMWKDNLSSGIVNVQRNLAEPIIDAEIDGNEWYGVADPNIEPTVEMGFLDGNQSPTIEERAVSGDILGMDFWCYIDFGGKAVGWRGMYKNPGQA